MANKRKTEKTPVEKEIHRREVLIRNLNIDIDRLTENHVDHVSKIKKKIADQDQVLKALKSA